MHHFALLFGYGAAAVNPYLALDTVRALADAGELPVDDEKAQEHYIHAVEEGLLKVMSKMGISTLQSLPRRADLRGGGARARAGRAALHRHARRASAAWACAELGREVRERHARGFGAGGASSEAAAARRAAATSGGAGASRTSGTRPRIATLQAAVRGERLRSVFAEFDAAGGRRDARAVQPARRCWRWWPRAAARSRSRRSSRRSRSSGASSPAPCPSARSAPRRTRRWPSR